jgi:CHAT domain-containing protein
LTVDMHRNGEGAAPTALTIRVVRGDIADVQASMIVVSHLSGLPLNGATAVIDGVLGGAISRRAASGALRGRFGTPWYLPTMTSPLAAGCVVVVLLGEPEYFNAGRLAETGAAIVDAADLIEVRDVATVLHGAGGLDVDPGVAANRIVTGVLDGLTRTDAHLRELTIVERDGSKLPAILRGVRGAVCSAGIHVYVEEDEIAPRRHTVVRPSEAGGIPAHLRLGITRSGSRLKVTTAGSGAFSCAAEADFPTAAAQDILTALDVEVLAESDDHKRALALESIGARLHNIFIEKARELNVQQQIEDAPGGLLVLGLDKETIDLPWELLYAGDRFLATTHSLGRHIELPFVGRQSAHPQPHESLRVLVVGDPTGELPEAREEAAQVGEMLRRHPRAEVTELIFNGTSITLEAVSRELDTRDFDVFHFAGHGDYDPLRENESGLQLGDRVLTADDLATRRWMPRLVVANACHSARTGPGGGNPFAGASRSRDMVQQMLGAGTRAFLGAMWAIPDQSAAQFATAFYSALLDDTSATLPTIGEAVRLARCALRTSLGPGDPTWAAYALYGSPWRQAL